MSERNALHFALHCNTENDVKMCFWGLTGIVSGRSSRQCLAAVHKRVADCTACIALLSSSNMEALFQLPQQMDKNARKHSSGLQAPIGNRLELQHRGDASLPPKLLPCVAGVAGSKVHPLHQMSSSSQQACSIMLISAATRLPSSCRATSAELAVMH